MVRITADGDIVADDDPHLKRAHPPPPPPPPPPPSQPSSGALRPPPPGARRDAPHPAGGERYDAGPFALRRVEPARGMLGWRVSCGGVEVDATLVASVLLCCALLGLRGALIGALLYMLVNSTQPPPQPLRPPPAGSASAGLARGAAPAAGAAASPGARARPAPASASGAAFQGRSNKLGSA
jgi:hypothetical protein